MFQISDAHWRAMQRGTSARPIDLVAARLAQRGIPVERDPRSGSIAIADRLGHRLRFEPDASGRVGAIVRPTGLTYRFAYDPDGTLSGIEFPSGRARTFERDRSGRITAFREAGLGETRLRRDDAGRLVSIGQGSRPAYRFAYDAEGRLVELVDRLQGAWRWQYGASGALAAIVDPLGNCIRLQNGASGGTRVDFPDGTWFQVAPAANGDGTVVHDSGGVETLLDSKGGHLAAIQWRNAHTVRRVEFTRDASGNVSEARCGDRFVRFARDGEARALAEHSEQGVVRYHRNREGLLEAMHSPFGSEFVFARDPDGRVCRITAWDCKPMEIGWNGENQIAAVTYPNGVVERRTLFPNTRLAELSLTLPEGRVLGTSYDSDAAARVTAVRHTDSSNALPPFARRFEYDAEDHLIAEADVPSGTSTRFTYDLAGNRVGWGALPVTVSKVGAPVGIGAHRVVWDARGYASEVPTRSGPAALEFGPDGLLAQCRIAGGVTQYEYDPLGRRIAKRRGGETWRFGWAEHRLLWEEYRRAPGAEPTVREWLYLPETYLPLAFRERGRTYWLQADARGAVERVLDDTGRLVWYARYDAFGEAHVVVQEVRQPMRLSGQYHDDESGLHYSLGRYYSPLLGCFLSRDPQWLAWEASPYSYGRNDPWNRVDPSGDWGPLLVVGIATAAGAVGNCVSEGSWTWANAAAGGAGGMAAGIGSVASMGLGPAAPLGILASAMLGAGLTEALNEMNRGQPLCWPCILHAATWGGAFEALFLGFGELAAPMAKPLLQRAGQWVRSGVRAVEEGVTAWRSGRHAGLTPTGAREVFQTAEEHGVRITVRPRTMEAAELIEQGKASPKPGSIGDNTINADDLLLGADPSAKGVVGRYKPDPAKLEEAKAAHPERAQELQERYNARQKAFEKGTDGIPPGYRIDPQGRIVGPDGKLVVGDVDAQSFSDPITNRTLTGAEAQPVVDDLAGQPNVQMQHGAQANYPETPGFKQETHDRVIREHTSKEQGGRGTPVYDFNPDGTWGGRTIDQPPTPVSPEYAASKGQAPTPPPSEPAPVPPPAPPPASGEGAAGGAAGAGAAAGAGSPGGEPADAGAGAGVPEGG